MELWHYFLHISIVDNTSIVKKYPDIKCDLKFILQLNVYKRWFNSESFYLEKTYIDNIYLLPFPNIIKIRVLGLQWIYNYFYVQTNAHFLISR